MKRLLQFIGIASLTLSFVSCGSSGKQADNTPSQEQCPSLGAGSEVLVSFPASALLNSAHSATIDPLTGGFSSIATFFPSLVSSAGAVATACHFVYVTAQTGAGSSVLAFVIGRGAPYSLTLRTAVALPASSMPGGLATTPDGRFLYVADQGAIDSFAIDQGTGDLTPLSAQPSFKGQAVQLTLDQSGTYLYASDAMSSKILGFSVGASGVLTQLAASPFALPQQGSVTSRPFGITSNGANVYVALSGTDQIAAFTSDAQTGVLTPALGFPMSTGKIPYLVVTTGRYVYVIDGRDGLVSGFVIDPSNGKLSIIPGSPFDIGANTGVIDATGRYFIVSKPVGIQGYNIDATTGVLSLGAATLANNGVQWLAATRVQ